MPLFAFANAGVELARGSGSVTLAVVLGLVIGKPLGITAAAAVAVRLRHGGLPHRVSWMPSMVAWLGGIGFTMSLFIATLAFAATERLNPAKTGILIASLIAGTIGSVLVNRGSRASSRVADSPASRIATSTCSAIHTNGMVRAHASNRSRDHAPPCIHTTLRP